jgi:hypothetical protein
MPKHDETPMHIAVENERNAILHVIRRHLWAADEARQRAPAGSESRNEATARQAGLYDLLREVLDMHGAAENWEAR